jgi:serine/threonine-protein kinase
VDGAARSEDGGVEASVRRVLGDRYELVELLATGGMGRVWRGRDLLLGRTVAVKLLRSEYTDDAVSLARFRAEAQVSARLVHRNIAALHDYGEAAGPDGETSAYLVMELVEGESLAARLQREPRPPLDLALDVVDQTAAALAAAHAAGVVHRDVKPGNVLLGADGIVRITDFGIAWSATSAPLTRTGQVVGTASYLSPEQAEGRQATPASDVYALGMVAYECLAGRRAFDGDSPVQIALRQIRDVPDALPDDVPANVRRLVDRALVKDPAERLADGAAVRAAVADVRAGRRIAPAPTPPTRHLPLPASGPRRRRRLLVPLVTLLAGAGLGIGALQVVGGPAAVVPPAAAASEDPDAAEQTVEVLAEEFVGRPADEVGAELVGRGLTVARRDEATAATAPGLVTAVGPVGRLAPGTLVTLSVAVGLPEVPSPAPGSPAPSSAASPSPGSSPSPGPSPSPSPSPETLAAVPPAATPAPVGTGTGSSGGGSEGGSAGGGGGNGAANGNGNGSGNGNGGGNGNGRGNGRG